MTVPETKRCRICQKPFNEYQLGQKNAYSLVACQDCGSISAEPWPTPEVVTKAYGDIQPEVVHVPYPDAEIKHRKKLFAGIMPGSGHGKKFLDVACRQGYGVLAAKELGFEA